MNDYKPILVSDENKHNKSESIDWRSHNKTFIHYLEPEIWATMFIHLLLLHELMLLVGVDVKVWYLFFVLFMCVIREWTNDAWNVMCVFK